MGGGRADNAALRKEARRGTKLAALEDLAAGVDYEPGKLAMVVMGDNHQRLMGWYDDLKHDRIPADMMGTNIRQAWEQFYAEAADFMRLEESTYLEYFHGKKQRIEQDLMVEQRPNAITDEPMEADEWLEQFTEEGEAG